MTPIQAILAERRRQIDVEGWTPAYIDQFKAGELYAAATCYCAYARNDQEPVELRANGAPAAWPWDAEAWKPENPRRDLARAGALILAERDRLRRSDTHAFVRHCDRKLDLIVELLTGLGAGSGDEATAKQAAANSPAPTPGA